jgi:hypothetical protein
MQTNNGVTFTAYLKDQFSGVFDKFTAKGQSAGTKVSNALGKISATGKTVSRSIDDIDKRLDHLQKTRRLSVDITQIKKANREIAALEKEKSRIGSGPGGSILGGLGKSILIGAGAGLGIGLLKEAGNRAMETTAKYQKMEAVLANTLGSKGAAQSSMEMIQKLAAETPFQVDELTAAYVKLVNQGFKPTRNELISLGDLASSTGKGMDQLAEAVLDAQTGEFERLKEFGIKGSKEKGGGMSFMFKGVKTEIDGSAKSIQEYILSLGKAAGVSGAMAAISKTTGGQLSNLSDTVDGLWKAIGESLTPTMNSGIGMMNSFIGTIKSWVEIPVATKINDQINSIKGLQTELFSANVSEERRQQLLNELAQINPKILEGINKQSVEYSKLASNIDSVTGALKNKIKLEGYDKANAKTLMDFSNAHSNYDSARKKSIDLIAQIAPELAIRSDLSIGKKQMLLQDKLQKKIASGDVTNTYKTIAGNGLMGTGTTVKSTVEEDQLRELKQNIKATNNSVVIANMLRPKVDEINKTKDVLEKQINGGLGDTKGPAKPGETTGLNNLGGGGNKKTKSSSLDSGGLSSISGGSSVKNVVISINNLNNGGINIHTSNLKEGANKAADIVTEALLTAVNDANLAN